MNVIINIDVPLLEPAITFYCNAFDLKLERLLDDDVAELTGASTRVYLLQQAEDSIPSEFTSDVRHYHRHWTPIHIDIVVDDMVSAAERVIKAGAKMESECIEWRGSRCISFADPFGHGFCLIQFEQGSYC